MSNWRRILQRLILYQCDLPAPGQITLGRLQMPTNLFAKTAFFSILLWHVSSPFCPLYSQQETGEQISAAKSAMPLKLIKTQGSSEHDNVHAMIQDRHGDLWFATTGEGVYRYNGKGFVQYTQEDGLGSNCVYSMIEDSNGAIWFGTDKGVSRYDGKSIAPFPFKFDSQAKQLIFRPTIADSREDANEVFSIMQTNSGSIWFGTTHGVYCYDGSKLTRLLDDFRLINSEKLRLKKIQCMLQDRSGVIWLGSGLGETEGLIRFDGKTITTVKPKIDGWIRRILQDKAGAIWLSTRSQGIWRENGDGFARVTMQDGDVIELLQANQTMEQDRLANIWFGGGEVVGTVQSNSGIWRYDGVSFNNFTIKDGLSAFGVWSLLEDNNGHVWRGTRNTGLIRFDGTHFLHFSE